jgi:hypothetical protein
MNITKFSSLAALTLLAVAGNARLAAMTWEEAVAASRRWSVAPYIAETFRFPGEESEIIHLLGRRFSGEPDAVSVTFNGVAAQSWLISGCHIITRRPAGIAGDNIQVTVTVASEVSDPVDATQIRELTKPVDLLQKPGEILWRNWVRSPDRIGSIEWGFTSNAYNLMVAHGLDIPEAVFREVLRDKADGTWNLVESQLREEGKVPAAKGPLG